MGTARGGGLVSTRAGVVRIDGHRGASTGGQLQSQIIGPGAEYSEAGHTWRGTELVVVVAVYTRTYRGGRNVHHSVHIDMRLLISVVVSA